MPEALILHGMADAEPDLSTFENKTGLAEDMKFLASMPELCDVTFLVGDTREPVCAVKVGGIGWVCECVCVAVMCTVKSGHCVIDAASVSYQTLNNFPLSYFLPLSLLHSSPQAVLASRSRVFAKMLYAAPSPQRKRETTTKENKLRLFLKRSSEPLLNLQNAAQQVCIYNRLLGARGILYTTWKWECVCVRMYLCMSTCMCLGGVCVSV